MAIYFCGETGCKGHHTFSQDCASIVTAVQDYPALIPFIQAIGEDDTQPYEPVQVEASSKARGQLTPAMKAYNNKMSRVLDAPNKDR